MNPYMMNQQTLVRVMGLEGAKAYQIGANSTVALFDSAEDVMYIKSTDAAGFPNIRIFEFKERILKQESNNYISREEFEEFKKEYIDGKQHIQSGNENTTV